MRYPSPLRYPGGKAGLVGFLANVIARNDLLGCPYYEPYAGGAGAALGLLDRGVVSELYLNDADVRIHSFWHAALQDSHRFVGQIRAVPLTLDEWYRQRRICLYPDLETQFDIGFATFFMNRCNRSGVVTGAGPIGGLKQAGKWRMDVRFNRDALAERVLRLARLKEKIHVTGADAVEFLKASLPRGRTRNNVFVYLDPPYVNKGQRLYLNSYGRADHAKLAEYIQKQSSLPWIMSYDDSDLVRKLYSRNNIIYMPQRYSLQEKRSARELIITPDYVSIPESTRVHGEDAILCDAQL